MRPSILLCLLLVPACSSDRTAHHGGAHDGGAHAGEHSGRPGPPTAPAPVLEAATIGAIAKLHALGPIYLASQPSADDLLAAQEAGVHTVINLRHESELDFDERALAEELGLTYRNLPYGSPEELTDAVLDEGRRLLRESKGPILLHCASSNRVGPIWIAHRVLDDGIELEEAVAEARTAGLRSPALEARAREYVARKP